MPGFETGGRVNLAYNDRTFIDEFIAFLYTEEAEKLQEQYKSLFE